MKSFVAGASGYTGQHLIKTLCSEGEQTIAHIRPNSSRLERLNSVFSDYGAEVDTTEWQADALAETFRRSAVDCIFSVIGTTKARGRAAKQSGSAVENYETVDYALNAMLVDAALAAGVSGPFVYLSSLGASATSSNAYMRARGRMEEKLIGSGLPYIIVRASFITGSDRDEFRAGERIGATLLDGVFSLGGRKLKAKYGSVSGEALGRFLAKAAGDPTSYRSIIEAKDIPRS
jgi:uncharacterized protein YbjT (DUF2867 family)